jgi:hypothetical protein
VHVPHPLRAVRRQPRVAVRSAPGHGVQVGGIEGEPPAEFPGAPDVAVAGHHQAHPRHGRQPLHPGAVITERIRRRGIEQRNLHVGTHIPGDQDTAVRQEHRAVAGRVPVMHDQPGLGPLPRDDRSVQ